MQQISNYIKIERNEITNKKAKKQAKLLFFPQIKIIQTLSNIKKRIRKGKNNVWQIKWQTNGSFKAIQTYKNLGLIPTTRI